MANPPERLGTVERVTFRLIPMPCCGYILCWVNPRWPTFCPSCGARCYPQVKAWPTITDDEAILEVHPSD